MCDSMVCVSRSDETLVHSLSKLAYRGYDSAGIALANSHIGLCKHSDKIADLSEAVSERILLETRWRSRTRTPRASLWTS